MWLLELSPGQELEPLATLKVKSAGLEPSDVIEVAVKPSGVPFGFNAVITATPEAWRLNAFLSASDASRFSLFSSILIILEFSQLEELELPPTLKVG